MSETKTKREWRREEKWLRRGKDFSVEVRRMLEFESRYDSELGPNRWFVYAYVSRGHALFGQFKGDDISQTAAQALPLHGGCTYLVGYTDGSEVYCWQAGADYNHYRDERFSYCATQEEAREVFGDAEELFAFLSRDAEVVPALVTGGWDADGNPVEVAS